MSRLGLQVGSDGEGKGGGGEGGGGSGEGGGGSGGGSGGHAPSVEPSSWHAALARHALPYVTPSRPQTGAYSLVHIASGLGLQGEGEGEGDRTGFLSPPLSSAAGVASERWARAGQKQQELSGSLCLLQLYCL